MTRALRDWGCGVAVEDSGGFPGLGEQALGAWKEQVEEGRER
jgi:hypothetical protein